MVHESLFHTFKAYNDTEEGDLDKLNKKTLCLCYKSWWYLIVLILDLCSLSYSIKLKYKK